MGQKGIPDHDRKKREPKPKPYEIHSCVAPIGYLKVVQMRTLKHVLLYNRHTIESARIKARFLASQLMLGRVIGGDEFCRG